MSSEFELGESIGLEGSLKGDGGCQNGYHTSGTMLLKFFRLLE
jgi:hypothetical protein